MHCTVCSFLCAEFMAGLIEFSRERAVESGVRLKEKRKSKGGRGTVLGMMELLCCCLLIW